MDQSDVIYLLKIAEIGLIASLKFLIAPFEAERYGFNFRDSFLITTSGGITGIIIFSILGELIAYSWKKWLYFFRGILQKNRVQGNGTEEKKFTWAKKFAVRIKKRFGLTGLVFITPSIISIPIGTFVIHRFYRKKIRNIFFLTISLIIWSLILNGLAQYLKLSQYLQLH
jgi:hypothetical protein